MLINWYYLIGGLLVLFFPARYFVTVECRYLEYLQVKVLRIDKNRRRRKWWKARHVWIEPLRGGVGAWALTKSVARAPEATGLAALAPSLSILVVLGGAVFWLVVDRRKRRSGSRRREEANRGEDEKAADLPAEDGASEAAGETGGTGGRKRPLNAPLFFIGGMMFGLFVVVPPVVAGAVMLMGLLGLLAFHHWGAACLLGGATMAVVGYLMMRSNIYVPALAFYLMMPALLSWYLRRPLVMAIRI